MDILEQHQVVCTIKLWYVKIFMGNFKEGGVLMVLPQKFKSVCVGNVSVVKAILCFLLVIR